MKSRSLLTPFLSLTSAVVLATVLSGCSLGLPQAQTDPTRYYVLSASNAALAAPVANAPVVRLRPIELASYLRGRPMVVRRGENELEFRDYARWGEPLEQGIARVLREELLATGAVSAVDGGGVRPPEAGEAKLEITVRVLACEGLANGKVNLHAVWELSPTSGAATTPLRGEFRGGDLHWTPKNEATLAAALSRGVAGMAAEIAAAIPKAAAGP